MYQKLEQLLPKKEKPAKAEKKVTVYIWKGSKIHFRGPCEFKTDDLIEVYIDKDNKKMLFVSTETPSKHAKKLTLYGKTPFKMFSLKRGLEVVEFTGTATFDAVKLNKEQLNNLGIDGIIGYEIDINKPKESNNDN